MISSIDYTDGLVRAAALALIIPRGKFYPDKNFGSNVKYTEPIALTLARARQAVEHLDGVYVKSVERRDDGLLVFNLSVNDIQRQVEAKYG
ncbi:hypothetical protein [uncultured Eubacterium sp.]|uniref:hypothetical protein n=1 Tax=uncultured Eubacterium sp. TaxID=165185 RepID=UPI0015B2E9A5|nr:hypothetical protein [uncultured Eubacterium sp.]DAL36923.1 MAG TPA_asm: hypothetical protein [Caudoviricetes sp.]